MRVPGRRMSAVIPSTALLLTLTLAGCGGSGDAAQSSAGSPTPTVTTSAPATPSPSSPGESSPTDGSDDSAEAVEIEVEIENGQVTPAGERVDVQVGQPIRFVVDSDAADEIHVHSTPEHSFSFPAGVQNRTFRFRLTRPGVVEAELHELGDVVVTIAARP